MVFNGAQGQLYLSQCRWFYFDLYNSYCGCGRCKSLYNDVKSTNVGTAEFCTQEQWTLKVKKFSTLITAAFPEHLHLFFLYALQHTSSMHWWFAHRNWFGGHREESPLGQSTSILSSEPSLQSSSPSQVQDKGIQRPVVLQRKSEFGHTRVSGNRITINYIWNP